MLSGLSVTCVASGFNCTWGQALHSWWNLLSTIQSCILAHLTGSLILRCPPMSQSNYAVGVLSYLRHRSQRCHSLSTQDCSIWTAFQVLLCGRLTLLYSALSDAVRQQARQGLQPFTPSTGHQQHWFQFHIHPSLANPGTLLLNFMQPHSLAFQSGESSTVYTLYNTRI